MRIRPQAFLLALCLSALGLIAPHTHGAGVTIITHGLESNVDDWVIAMAAKMPTYHGFPGSTFTCYEIYFTRTNSSYVPTWRRLGGENPFSTDSGEILVKLDWRQLANDDYSTFDVATAIAPRLLQTNFISEMNGHALAELPLHLIGHSRGGSLVAQLSRLLGTNGVWVDHLTTLDPHPMNNDGFFDFPYTVEDAPVRTYENVLFHDNYYQTINLLFYGEAVAGAYVRELTDLDGGYDTISAAHSDVHLWYHGTVDLQTPTSDTVASIHAAERGSWWSGAESSGRAAGFYYSLIGGGDRFSTNQPVRSSNARVKNGYNQRWNLGAGNVANRSLLPANNGSWPDLLRLNLTGTNVMAQGQSNGVTLYYQWAQPATSNATIELFLDDDFNPFNENERLLRTVTAPGTTSTNVGIGTASIQLATNNSTPGMHSLFAKITGSGRTRFLYAPEVLTVFSSFGAPALRVTQASSNGVRVDVTGIPGQRLVLQRTESFQTWQSLATNWLVTPVWSYVDGFSSNLLPHGRFYRAVLE